MTVISSCNSDRDYWKTPPRGFRHAVTGDPIPADVLNQFLLNPAAGGPPMRGESDAEYQERTGLTPY